MKKKKEEQVKLPPIDGKKKSKDDAKKKDEYPEHVVIMDAEDIHKAIEGERAHSGALTRLFASLLRKFVIVEATSKRFLKAVFILMF